MIYFDRFQLVLDLYSYLRRHEHIKVLMLSSVMVYEVI